MHPRRERWTLLASLARRQEWTVSTEQLYALGSTFAEIRGLVEAGHLFRLHRGVYTVGRREVSRRGWLFAAQLACGEGSFLCHRTAIGVRGLCPVNPYAIHVAVLGSGSRRRSDLIIHRIRVEPGRGEVSTVRGLRASTIYRALIEAAADESREWLEQMIESAVRKKLLDVSQMEATIAAHPGARGLTRLKAAFAAYRPWPFDKFGLETAVAAAIAADPSIPEPQRDVRLEAGGISWQLDFWWPDLRVVLETDGNRYHLTPGDKERDRIKDAKLMAAGITPLRITDVRWDLDPRGAMDDLRAVLSLRRGSAA